MNPISLLCEKEKIYILINSKMVASV